MSARYTNAFRFYLKGWQDAYWSIITSTSLKPLDAKSYIKGLGGAIKESTLY